MALSGGTLFKHDSVDDTLVLVKGHNCTISAIRAINTTAADAFVQLFDAAAVTDVTLGTTLADWVVHSQADEPSLGDGLPTDGVTFRNGLVIASTTTVDGSAAAEQHVRIAIK